MMAKEGGNVGILDLKKESFTRAVRLRLKFIFELKCQVHLISKIFVV